MVRIELSSTFIFAVNKTRTFVNQKIREKIYASKQQALSAFLIKFSPNEFSFQRVQYKFSNPVVSSHTGTYFRSTVAANTSRLSVKLRRLYMEQQAE